MAKGTFYEESMAEVDLLRAVLSLAEVGGWRAAHFHDSRRQVGPGRFVGDAGAAGWPDLVLSRAGRVLFRELKTMKGAVSKVQQGWIGDLQKAGFDAGVWRPCDLPEIERELLAGLGERGRD